MEPSTSKRKSDDEDSQTPKRQRCSSASCKRKDDSLDPELEPIKKSKRNTAEDTSLSVQSTSGESQKSSDSKVKDAPREVPSLEHWSKLAQEELEIGQGLNIEGLHTVVCIDISDSMKLGDAWKQSKEFFTQFIQGLKEIQEIAHDEHVALSVFGWDVRVVQRLTKKYSHLKRAFDSLKPGGPSPLYGGLLMALAGVTSVTATTENGVKIESRIILVTDGHPTNPLLVSGSDDYDPDKKKKNQVTALKAADIISSKGVRIDCVPVGEADVSFLHVLATRVQGKVYSYKDGRKLARRTVTCCNAGHVLHLWKMMSLLGNVLEPLSTDILLDGMMELPGVDQITSLSKDEQEEVLEIAKDAFKTDVVFDVLRDLEYNYEFEDPDVKLPPLGTRVRRGPDLNSSQRDDFGPGTIVGHHKNKRQVRVEWDATEKADLYYCGEKEKKEVTIVDEPRILQSNQLIATGCHVRRGKDWKYGDQDGTPGTIGVVIKVQDDGFVWIRWPDKRKYMYRFGVSGKFDLEICPFKSHATELAPKPGHSSAPGHGTKTDDESLSGPLSSKTSQKGMDTIIEVYTRTAVITTTQSSPTQTALTATTSTSILPTTIPGTSILPTTNIMMAPSTSRVVPSNTLTSSDSTASLTTAVVMETPSETSTTSVLNTSSSVATSNIQTITVHENAGASLSTNPLRSSNAPVSNSASATEMTSSDSSSDYTQTATNTDNHYLSEPVSRVSSTYWEELAQTELVEAQMRNTPGIHTVICVDTSASMMQKSAWKEAQQFFDEFIEELETINKDIDLEEEQIALTVFGQEVKVVQRLSTNYTQLREAFSTLQIEGPTPMYGGLQMALAGFAIPGELGCLDQEFSGLLMSLAGIAGISVPIVNGIRTPPRIIIITDGHPTDTLLSSGPDVRVSNDEAKSDVMKAAMNISQKKICIYIVPVGDADDSFLSLMASKADGQIVSYKDGRKLAKRTINNLYAGIVLQQWKAMNEIGKSCGTEISLEDVMDVPEDSQIALLSDEKKVEVLHTAKHVIEKGLLEKDDDDELEKHHYEFDDNTVDLPPLGTRVRRATYCDRGIQDDDGPGTIVGQHKTKKQVRVEWDKNGICDFYRYGDEEKYDVSIVNEDRILQTDELIATGCHVRRGKDWRWGNQGGTPSAVGVVIRVRDDDWVWVRWPDKSKNRYRFGADGCCDLELCDQSGNAIEGQTTSGILQAEQMSTPLQWPRNPTSLLPQPLSIVKKLHAITQKEFFEFEDPDIKLPPVGTRVRRGPKWTSGQEDDYGPGTIIGHHEDKIHVRVEWDKNGKRYFYCYDDKEKQHVIVVNEPRVLQSNERIATGCRVRRGPDWMWENQDGTPGAEGVVIRVEGYGLLFVRWPDKSKYCYRFGFGGCYDLELCDKSDNPDESQIADGTAKSAQTSTPLKPSVPSSFPRPDLQTLRKKLAEINRNTARKFNEFDDPDIKLPSLGTRVRRGPDWNSGQQDDDGPGTIISHHENKRYVLVEWDNNGTCDFYRFDDKDKHDVMVVNEPRILQSNERVATGCRVRRGKDWKWGNQDGTPGAEGVVIQVQEDDRVWVRWPHKERNIYRFGFEGCFDLEVCNPDEKHTVGVHSQPGHVLDMQMFEASSRQTTVPTTVITTDMQYNNSTSTVSFMTTSTMQPPTIISTVDIRSTPKLFPTMTTTDTSSSVTEAITTTDCTMLAKTSTNETQTTTITTTSSVTSSTITGLPGRLDRTKSILCRTEYELGRGCYGTIVYKGKFDERDVAVKRLLLENFNFAEREMELLRQSDEHPNVIRYYWNEKDDHFLYIALELCEGTLQDYVEDKLRNIKKLEPIELLHQTMKGLAHLHSLGIVHRDLKPHNILISRPGAQGEVRALISDFGLSRKLPPGKVSFSSKSDVYGTDGWAAPEMSKTGQNKTLAVDIFSAGCLMYYVLTSGKHPFGNEPFHIQSRIHKGKFKLDELPTTSDGYIAKDIIQDMLSSVPEARPTAKAVLKHLLFWNNDDKLRFIEATSDRIQAKMVPGLETDQDKIFELDWAKRLSQELKNDLGKDARFYNTSTVKDLLRVIRNKRHHYNQLPEDVQKSLGSIPGEYLDYFTSRFPSLLVHTYRVMKCCSKEGAFKPYYKTK